jgi:hypothetical protein
MRVRGRRVKERQLIERGRLVVAVDVDLVYPEFDPDSPCYESETIEFLREVAERAETADVAWLSSHGTVFELMDTSATHPE